MSHVLNFNNWSKLNEEATALAGGNYAGLASNIVGMLMAAMGSAGTDEEKIYQALQKITNRDIYVAVVKLVQTSPNIKRDWGKNFNTVMDFIQTDFFQQKQGEKSFTNDGEWLQKYEDILNKFNENERYSVKFANYEI